MVIAVDKQSSENATAAGGAASAAAGGAASAAAGGAASANADEADV